MSGTYECAVCQGSGKIRRLKASAQAILDSSDPSIRNEVEDEFDDDYYEYVECDNPFCEGGQVTTTDDE